MPPKAHATLSASAADRWLHCPPSARLSELYEDRGSDFAAEGTDAHALCEYKLQKALGREAEDPTETLTWFNEEMSDCAEGYAAYVMEQVEAAKQTCADPVVLVEQRVDFSRWVESGFGTADCIIIADGTLKICDYKHGRGVEVSAEENPQMMCYALGALELFDYLYDIDRVSMTIYQPRRSNISTYEMAKDDLYRWADEVLKPTAELAFAGDGNFLCGEWCTFCKASRPEFQKLLVDCRAGKIDMVITKSISRFARNTVTLLKSVRELKALGVDIFFEEQNLHTMSGDGELMLTILASYAQEESKSVSDNMKWRIRKNFEEGKPWDGTILGYRYKEGQYVIQPDEAETVRRIFELYLSGLGCAAVAKVLNAEGRVTRLGNMWGYHSIQKIIRNDTYTGNLTLQKTFREDHISKRVLINNGELPKYYAEETHEAIIPQETFDRVQAEIARRVAARKPAPEHRAVYPFTGKLTCAICGKNYRRKNNARGPIWMCVTFNCKSQYKNVGLISYKRV